MVFVGQDHGLDERMPHDILLGEKVHSYAIDIPECGDGFYKAAELVARQVDLCDIPRHHAAGAKTEASEEHEHLLGGGVLSLIEDDKRSAEGASAHVGQRGDFDDVFIHELLQLIRLQKVVQRIVERPQVGEDFFLQVTGKETQSLACFDGLAL